MKQIVSMIFVAGLALPVYADEPQTKKVCMDVKDASGNVVKNKDGTTKQNCKEVTVRQKHEGTKIPEKK